MSEQEKTPNLKNEIEQLHKTSPSCRNCRENKEAEKPFAEMTKFEMTPLATKVAHETAKKYGINKNCFVCLSIHSFMKKPFDQQMKILSGEKHD